MELIIGEYFMFNERCVFCSHGLVGLYQSICVYRVYATIFAEQKIHEKMGPNEKW
jgi:hypothetical protein